MRTLFLTALVGLTAAAAVAVAQPSQRELEHNPATLCLDGGGNQYPAVCSKQQASRFPSPPDICHCNGPYRRVDASWCGPGEKPPAESAEYSRARAAASAKDGTLVGKTYKGQRMCVALTP